MAVALLFSSMCSASTRTSSVPPDLVVQTTEQIDEQSKVAANHTNHGVVIPIVTKGVSDQYMEVRDFPSYVILDDHPGVDQSTICYSVNSALDDGLDVIMKNKFDEELNVNNVLVDKATHSPADRTFEFLPPQLVSVPRDWPRT